MAGIKNEIVKFIADVELDPQQAAQYQKSLEDCEKSADALRKSIADTTAKMEAMRDAGQESTSQYAALKKSLEADSKALKEAGKNADKYAEALGIGSMSLSQLQKHAKQCRQALANTHKEANPKVWAKYNDELKKTEDRIREVKSGGEKTGKAMKGLGAQIAGGFTVGSLAMKAFDGAVNLVKKGFDAFTKATQVWGDRWVIVTDMVNAGWQQFIANIGQGSNVMKGSIKDAMRAAKEAAQLRDELFERTNSFKMMESDARVYINTQTEIANNSSKSAKERMDALDNIIAKEQELAETKKSLAEQERTAAIEMLRSRTSMTDEELKFVIDNYEGNRDLITQAGEYNELLEKRSSIMANFKWANNQVTVEANAKALDEVDRQLKGWDETIVEAARLTRQYNLANDDLVNSYVNATLAFKQADEELTAASAAQARKRGTLQKQIDADEAAKSNKAYQDRINAAQSAYDKEMLLLKQQLAARQITETEYNVRSQAAEISMLNAKIAINQSYGKDVTDLQTKIADKQLASQKAIRQALEKNSSEFTQMLKKMNADAEAEADKLVESLTAETAAEMEALLDSLPEDVDIVKKISRLVDKENDTEPVSRKGKRAKAEDTHKSELADLEDLHELQLISEEEYLARKKQLNEDYAKAVAEINLQTWQGSLDTANQFLDAAGNMVNSLRDAELNKLEAQMQAELTAAGDNAEEKERIEAEYEQKKLDTQKKYADVDLAIAAAPAAEVASIVQQRNAIKNQTVGASGNSSSSSGVVQTREVTGYADGGYTGRGGRYEPAGIVHRGEYVVAQPELRDPSVAREIARIERKRLSRLRGKSPSVPGFAEGGYTSGGTTLPANAFEVLHDIYSLLRGYFAQTPMAYVVLSQLQAQEDYQKRVKSKISL